MLDINQIVKDLASMVYEQGDTVGKHNTLFSLFSLFYFTYFILKMVTCTWNDNPKCRERDERVNLCLDRTTSNDSIPFQARIPCT